MSVSAQRRHFCPLKSFFVGTQLHFKTLPKIIPSLKGKSAKRSFPIDETSKLVSTDRELKLSGEFTENYFLIKIDLT